MLQSEDSYSYSSLILTTVRKIISTMVNYISKVSVMDDNKFIFYGTYIKGLLTNCGSSSVGV